MGPFQLTSCSTVSACTVGYLPQEDNAKLKMTSNLTILVNPTVYCLDYTEGSWNLNPHAMLFSHGNSYSQPPASFQKQPNAKSENELFLTFPK